MPISCTRGRRSQLNLATAPPGPGIQTPVNCANLARSFTLSDALVLIAATAVGMALARSWWDVLMIEYFRALPEGSLALYLKLGPILVIPALPFASAWTVAIMILRLKKPRPTLRLLFRQPGTAACAAASFLIALLVSRCAVGCVCQILLRGESSFLLETEERYGDKLSAFLSLEFEPALGSFGLVIGAVWVLLTLTHLSTSEPTWIERAGRGLGGLWILIALGQWWSEIALFCLRETGVIG